MFLVFRIWDKEPGGDIRGQMLNPNILNIIGLEMTPDVPSRVVDHL